MDDFFTGRDALIGLAVKYRGDWNQIYAGMRLKEKIEPAELKALLSTVKCKTLTVLDAEYPDEFRKSCRQPPFVLFYYGDISLMWDYRKILTIVGSRSPSDYAAKKARELAGGIADHGYIVASGLARGIDTCVGEATAGMPGKSIAILGCGIEETYPPENLELRKRIAKTGLLLSEYPGTTPPSARNFPMRNRILAAISYGTFIAEAGEQSGTLITAAFATEYNRDLAALPFRCDEGLANNRLIKGGAALVESVNDLDLFMSCATLT